MPGAVGEVGDVEHLVDGTVRGLLAAGEAARAAASDQTPFEQPGEGGVGGDVEAVVGVVGGQQAQKAGPDQRHQVDAHQVEQPEHAGAGRPEMPGHHSIGGFDADTAPQRF